VPKDPIAVVQDVLSTTIDQATNAIKPQVAAVVQTFGFPVGLALAVLAFLIIQNHLDRRDPKLRAGTSSEAETFLPFEGEDEA
jgi:hypothetical protein